MLQELTVRLSVLRNLNFSSTLTTLSKSRSWLLDRSNVSKKWKFSKDPFRVHIWLSCMWVQAWGCEFAVQAYIRMVWKETV